MNELRKLIFVSPGLLEFGNSGHYSTLHKSLKSGCLQVGVSLEISGRPKSGLGIPNLDLTKEPTALVYEGDFGLLRDSLLSPRIIPTFFNFLRSNDYLFLWLFLKLKGAGGFDAVKGTMGALQRCGWVFSADSENLKRRLLRLGFPIDTEFPFSSAFSGRRNFSQSEWQLGMMAESRLDWTLNVITARLASFIKPNLKIKLLNTSSAFQSSGTQHLGSIAVTSLPAVGEEYLDRLSARFWFLPGKSSHHIFGSSGRSLDIISNGGMVFTRKFNSLGATSLNEPSSCVRSWFPRFRAVGFAIGSLTHPDDLKAEISSSDRTSVQTITTILEALGRQANGSDFPKIDVEEMNREIQSFENFCARKSTSLLFRLLLRLPRWFLWKLTD